MAAAMASPPAARAPRAKRPRRARGRRGAPEEGAVWRAQQQDCSPGHSSMRPSPSKNCQPLDHWWG